MNFSHMERKALGREAGLVYCYHTDQRPTLLFLADQPLDCSSSTFYRAPVFTCGRSKPQLRTFLQPPKTLGQAPRSKLRICSGYSQRSLGYSAAIMNARSTLSLLLALVPALVQAQGDYACIDNNDCATGYTQFPITKNSTCVPGKPEQLLA